MLLLLYFLRLAKVFNERAHFSLQFQPGAPAQQGQPFAPPVQMPNIGMGPGQSQAMQFSQPMQQFPPRPGQPGHITSSQPIQMPSMQPNMPIPSVSMQPQQMIPSANNHMPGVSATGLPFSLSHSV